MRRLRLTFVRNKLTLHLPSNRHSNTCINEYNYHHHHHHHHHRRRHRIVTWSSSSQSPTDKLLMHNIALLAPYLCTYIVKSAVIFWWNYKWFVVLKRFVSSCCSSTSALRPFTLHHILRSFSLATLYTVQCGTGGGNVYAQCPIPTASAVRSARNIDDDRVPRVGLYKHSGKG